MNEEFNYVKFGAFWLVILAMSIILAVIAAKWSVVWVKVIAYVLFITCTIMPIGLLFLVGRKDPTQP